jgi:hypothetical protein
LFVLIHKFGLDWSGLNFWNKISMLSKKLVENCQFGKKNQFLREKMYRLSAKKAPNVLQSLLNMNLEKKCEKAIFT